MSKSLDIIVEQSKVILIGSSSYEHNGSFPNIAPIKNNINDLAQLFADQNICGINTIVEISDEISYDIKKKFAEESRNVEDTLVVYYAGHGHRSSGTLFLTGKDSDKKFLEETCIDYKDFYRIVEKSNAQKKIILLDCCYSGIATLSSDGDFVKELDLKEVKGVYTLAASLSTKRAEFDDKELYTFFTGELIDLLKTGINNNKSFIDLNEAFQIIKDNLIEKNALTPVNLTN